jgi:phage repressor protein C with HTH and peptisase S24 domain
MDHPLVKRLKQLQGEKSVRAFAVSIGVNPSTLRVILSSGNATLDTLTTIARHADVSLAWLVSGDASMSSGSPSEAGIIEVPLLSVEASAGVGRSSDGSEELVGTVPFPQIWLRKLTFNVAALRLLKARGGSMAPTINDGDQLLVDTSVNTVADDAIYVLVIGDQLRVKRVQLLAAGGLTLVSDSGLSPEMIPASDVSTLHIAGRVVWVGRAL